MNQQWKEFLSSQGAFFNNSDQITHFDMDEDPIITECLLTDLSHQGILAVNGQDAGKFLQGQLSCDTTQVNSQFSRLGTYCTIKGRAISSFRIVHYPHGYQLIMHRDLVPITQAILSKYIVFFKAQMQDNSAQIIRLGIAGSNCEAELQTLFGNIPGEINQVIKNDIGQLIRIPGPDPRFELWTKQKNAEELWTAIAEFATPVNHSIWELLNIRTGLIELTPVMSEEFTPHNLNYQATGHIDFKKGCYTGQEVVARIHYRGQSKKRLYRIAITSDKEPDLNDNILVTNDSSKTIVGNILSVSQYKTNSYEALAIISTNPLENSTLTLKSDHHSSIELLSLPYNV